MYERLENPELQLAEAKKIQTKFLDNGSQYQVNIDYELVNNIRDNISSKNADKTTFEDAKQWIYELMRTDSYPRYVILPLFSFFPSFKSFIYEYSFLYRLL